MPPERLQTADSWRQQVLQRLANEASRRGVDVQRLQQRLAFERLLARLPADGTWVLKGGFALQVRYGLTVRPTKDIDLLVPSPLAEALAELQAILAKPSGEDRLDFVAQPARALSGDAAGTLRVQILSRLSDRNFVRFHIDLVGDEVLTEEPERLQGMDLLSFAGIAPANFPVFPLAQHLAEKLHAYTQPRTRENSRVKDLVDLVLIPNLASIAADQLHAALAATFRRTDGHALPARLPDPPLSWAVPFATVSAVTPGAPTSDLGDGYKRAARFWDPILATRVSGQHWMPELQRWGHEQER